MNKRVFVVSTFVLATITGLMTGASAYTAEKFTPEANKASYWGANCVKYDNFNGKTYKYTATDKAVTKVVIKAGTQNTIHTDKFENIGAENGKAISHIIVCTGEPIVKPVQPVKPVTPVEPAKPVKPVESKEKEDKNQSACNPSDTRSANLKHRDDGDKCKDNTKPSKPVIADEKKEDSKPAKGEDVKKDDKKPVSAPVEKDDNQGKGGELPDELPRTGVGVLSMTIGLLASVATYGALLRRQ